jgi:pimeloyl-[acyl-carrier protein] methyl ester esterase
VSRLYTEISGSGPTLVLLHGWGLNVRVWDGLAAALRDRFRIIAVDLPGHGRSAWLPERSSLEEQAAQVHETIAGIASDYSLLGWSLGGQIALQLAAAQHAAGDRHAPLAASLERLVLIAATPRLVAAPDWPHGAPPERLTAQAAGLRTDYRRTVSDFLELQVRGSAGGAEALERLRAALFAHGDFAPATTSLPAETDAETGASESDRAGDRRPFLAALTRGLELLRDTDLRPLLPDVTLPTLVIAGQYDRVTMPAASHALADSLPNARYVEIRRAAHAPFLSHLPELSALISGFLLQP